MVKHWMVWQAMSENSAIKRFDCYPPNYTCPLFPTRENRMPIVRKILSSPWVERASDLLVAEDSSQEYGLGKRCSERVRVFAASCREGPLCRERPLFFQWRGRRYRIDSVPDSWRLEDGWWEEAGGGSRLFFRVLAHGGIFDLSYDLARGEWRMEGWWD